MEKVISNEMTKIFIVLGAGVIALTALMANRIAKLRGSFKPYWKPAFFYLFVALIFFAVVAFIPMLLSKQFTAFVLLQAYFLLLGSIHLYTLPQNLQWSTDRNALLPAIFFTVLIGCFGAVSFLLVSYWLNKNGLQVILASSVLFFVIPFFFYQAFRKAMAIPPKVLKEWFYPVHEDIEEPDDSKLKNMLVISFEIQKQATEGQLTNFRAKAPMDMEFGQLFYFFINDYNERHPNSKVQYANGSGEPHGWIFYKKPQWFTVSTRYIDAEKTIFNNRIKENDVIICRRSLS